MMGNVVLRGINLRGEQEKSIGQIVEHLGDINC